MGIGRCPTCTLLIVFIAICPVIILYVMKNNPAFMGTFPFMAPRSTWQYHFSNIPDLSGKVAIVTGANVGLGFYTAKHLAARNAITILACRSQIKCEAAAARIKDKLNEITVVPMLCDLASLQSIKNFVETFKSRYSRLDILVLNAGVMNTPYTLSEDGIELHFAVNHLGHYYLTKELLPELEHSISEQSFATVVSVSSNAHYFFPYGANVELSEKAINDEKNYDRFKAYGQSKLYNVLFAQELAERVHNKKIYVNSLNPGGVSTNLYRHWIELSRSIIGDLFTYLIEAPMNLFMWPPETASLTILYAATSPEIASKDIRGQYLVPIGQLTVSSEISKNKTFQKKLWDFSESLIEEKIQSKKSANSWFTSIIGQ